MGRICLQKKEPVWFGCFYIFLLPQTMLPSNDQIANQSCSSGQQQMATLLGVVEKYTRNRFQLSESVPLKWVTPFASTELALKHSRNKIYTELVLQELALQE